jgi:hypothetical protein
VVPELRPRSVGEVLDAAVRLYRARFGSLMTVSIVVLIPVSILSMFVLLSALPDEGPVGVTTSSPVFDTGDNAAQFGAILVTAVLSALATTFVTAATTRLVADAYVGQQSDTREAVRATVRRVFPLIGLSLVVWVATTIGFFLCFVPGFWLQAAWCVAVPALLLEGLGVFRALGRSFQLTKVKFWLAFGVFWLSQLLVLALSTGLAAAFAWATRSNDSASASVIAQSVANAAASIITVPFAATAIVALYFDLRIRAEAFDVQMMIAGLDDKRAPGSVPA